MEDKRRYWGVSWEAPICEGAGSQFPGYRAGPRVGVGPGSPRDALHHADPLAWLAGWLCRVFCIPVLQPGPQIAGL